MQWTKIPTNILINRYTDQEIVSIVKYQLLWAELEYKPDDKTALRYMTNKQLSIVKQYINDIEAQVKRDIQLSETNRNNRKLNYLKNKEKIESVSITLPVTVSTTVEEQIREDKIINKEKEKEKESKTTEKEYAFEGDVIKLNQKDYDAWQKKYDLLDLAFELEKRDIWLSGQEKVGNWFISTKQYLLTLQKKKADEKKEDEEYKQRMCKSWWRE